MGDVDGGDFEFTQQVLEFKPQRLTQLRIHRAQWLIQQQHLRVSSQRPRQSNPLLLPPTNLMRKMPRILGHAHKLQKRTRLSHNVGLGKPLRLQTIRHIILYFHVGKQRRRLEDIADFTFTRRKTHRFSVGLPVD
ncbi:MAG: hypothetical protein NWF04_05450 [Candidatus Bathyarchaeota archaeon]|nr:hypothetical protein [Candidatus Bathyarchaeota archaeon]